MTGARSSDTGGQAKLCVARHPYTCWETHYFRLEEDQIGGTYAGSAATLLTRDPLTLGGTDGGRCKGHSDRVPKRLRGLWALVVSTARKYRNRYGSGGTRIDAPGR